MASDQIIEGVNEHFSTLHRADYGGNLLSVIYPNLELRAKDIATSKELDAAIAFLLDMEDVLLRHPVIDGATSFFTIIIGTPRNVM